MSARKRPMWRKREANYVYTADKSEEREKRRADGWPDDWLPLCWPWDEPAAPTSEGGPDGV